MAKFLNGLNKEIVDICELQHYIDLEKMVRMATNIERQLKGRRNTRGATNSTLQFNSRWLKRGDNRQIKENKDKQPTSNPTGNPNIHATRQSSVKYFKCLGVRHITSQYPNQQAMILQDDGDIVNDHDIDTKQEEVPSIVASEESI